jgi:hypothetical protein
MTDEPVTATTSFSSIANGRSWAVSRGALDLSSDELRIVERRESALTLLNQANETRTRGERRKERMPQSRFFSDQVFTVLVPGEVHKRT